MVLADNCEEKCKKLWLFMKKHILKKGETGKKKNIISINLFYSWSERGYHESLVINGYWFKKNRK